MELRVVPVEQINPAPFNPRIDLKPGDDEYKALAESLESFGVVEPLVWNQRSGNLVGGHQRLKVLRAQNHATVEVSVVDLDDAREKALNLALNKTGGDWDQRKLAVLLDELLADDSFDFTPTGFALGEARDLVAEVLGDGEACREDVFDPAAFATAGPAVTRPGDLLHLGRDPKFSHRLFCGDATDEEQVRLLMGDQRAVLFATDPPYLVDYARKRGGRRRVGKPRRKQGASSVNASNASLQQSETSEEFDWDDPVAQRGLYDGFLRAAVAAALRPDAAWYTWYASRNHSQIEQAWIKSGAFVHCQIIWVKASGVPTRGWYRWQHEPCLMGWVKGNRPPRVDPSSLTTVWNLESPGHGRDRPDHPTPKPLEAFEIPMRQHTHHGEVCYEPFVGSGTQFIAAERLGRRCFGMEISAAYCDVIVRRFIAFAGEGAVAPEIADRYRLPDQAGGEPDQREGKEVAA